MSRITEAFSRARRERRAAFIPFITAGDPSPDLTVPICEALARAGADIVELGVPFSDPLADGPTIQRASQRALEHGVGLKRSLEIAAQIRSRLDVALVLFTYCNPVLRMGVDRFARLAREAGIDGVLVTDLPLEEGGDLRAELIVAGIDPILLAAPTSGPERVAAAGREGRGFIYYISRTGVTGARGTLPEGLAEEIREVRRAVPLPVAVGFGISTAEQVLMVSQAADGVVVGSALVAVIDSALESGVEPRAIPALVEDRARGLSTRREGGP